MKNLDEFQIELDGNLKDAMEAITANMRGMVFVTKNKKVVGLLSDGDIRRALLKGVTTLAPVSSIMNQEFVFTSKKDRKAIKKIMDEKKIYSLPVLDQKKHLVDLVFIDEL